MLEHNGIDDINLPTQYASLAQCALELDMPDSAFVALQKAAALPKRTTYQEFTVNKGFGLYYIRCGNFAEAEKRLEASEELFRRDPSLRFHTAGLRYLQMTYFKASGQYGRALKTILETQRDTVVRSSGYNNYVLTKELGDIYWHLRRMEQAAVNYREYIRLSDSVRNREIRTATDDFSGILEISRLHNETKELQYDLQCKRLRNTYLIICLLGGVLVTGGVGYARMVKLNRRLKASEATVLAQNEHLRISGEELLKAKEQAEQASRMKTEFIQHMSHEVRTPLNSIVGFSQVMDKAEVSSRMMDNLKKFYPAVHDKLTREGMEKNRRSLRGMLDQGIVDGLFVDNINIDLAISVLYYTASALVTRKELMLPAGMTEREAFVQIISNFFRGISTAKGLRLIDDNLKRYELTKYGK